MLGRGALLAVTVIWGASFVVMKNTLDSITTFYILTIRFSGAAVLLLLFCLKRLKKIDRGYLCGGALMGVSLLAAYIAQTFGLQYTTPGKNAFLTASYCVIVPFMYWALIKKRPDRYNVISAAVCIAGMALISLDGNLRVGKGDALTMVSGLFFAAHIVVTSGTVGRRDPLLLTMIQFATAGILSGALALIFEPFPARIPTETLWGLSYLIVLSTAVCLLLQVYGQKYTPPSQAAIIMTLESVFGALCSVLFYHERLTPQLLAGFILTFCAVLVSETKLRFFRRKAGATEQEAR